MDPDFKLSVKNFHDFTCRGRLSGIATRWVFLALGRLGKGVNLPIVKLSVQFGGTWDKPGYVVSQDVADGEVCIPIRVKFVGFCLV